MKILLRIMAVLLVLETYILIYVQANPTVETIIQREINEVEVEKIVEVEKVVEVEPQYTYHITSAEREMLARLVYREANVESIECQKAVVSVVINRLHSGDWEIHSSMLLTHQTNSLPPTCFGKQLRQRRTTKQSMKCLKTELHCHHMSYTSEPTITSIGMGTSHTHK